MSALEIYAGPLARERIKQQGFRPELFSLLLGASGGPKWFVLYGLDRYLFGDFFASRKEPLMTMGSSAGAWRLSCLGTAEPLRAIDELASRYSSETYSEQPSIEEITGKMRNMLADVLGPSGAAEIAGNTVFRTHIIADRCKGIANSRHASLQKIALGSSAMANILSRRTLSWFFQRTIFTNMGDMTPFLALNDLDTAIAPLVESNVIDAMIASGSIPFILEGVRDIEGASKGLYWDGGITDYHFDMPFTELDGLVLYPHFSPKIVPGWFDKMLRWRRPPLKHFDNVVLLTPSAEWTASLPGAKIPDRTDFERYGEDERLDKWQQVLDASHQLAREFSDLISSGDGLSSVKDFSERPV